MEAKSPITCARRGDVDFFKTVAPEILLEARDFNRAYVGSTVLTTATREGHLDCCEVIVERCTQLLYHQKDYNEWSVLHDVANSINNLEKIMRFLITADSKPDLELGGRAKIPNNRLLKMQSKYGETALHVAVRRHHPWATKLLLEADRDFELLRMVDHDGQTCLHRAAEYGDHVSAELMIKAWPDIEFLKMTSTRSKKTALHVAVENGKLEMVKLICEANPDKQLLSMPDSQGNTPLHLAMDKAVGRYRSSSDSKIVCMLLEKDPNQCTKLQDEHKQPFIHVAVKLGLNDVVETILKSKKIEATILNKQDKDGNTPLHIAALGQEKCMTLWLLYDERVSKEIENNKKEKAIDLFFLMLLCCR